MRWIATACALAAACGFSTRIDNSATDAAADAIPDASACRGASQECLGDVLRACSGEGALPVDRTCPVGCTTSPDVHCVAIQPHGGGAVAADLDSTGLANVSLQPNLIIDGDTGRIGTTGNPTLVRGSGPNILNGIDYQVRGTIAVFRFKKLTIQGDVALIGGRAIVLVSDDDLDVGGVIDARGTCVGTNAGPGGHAGGPKATDGVIAGNGGGTGTSTNKLGGGGGGHGGVGGVGRDTVTGGPVFGDAVITVLEGGGGGGGGGGGAGAGAGGGGGGAIQLLSNGRIRIPAGAGINAGGCGGATGIGGNDGGGGGGAGGTILLEGRTVDIDGTLAGNGGGGGGGDANPDGIAAPGTSGRLARTAALGFPGPTAAGGNGGAGATYDGGPGTNGGADDGGGGGGAVGRIRIDTLTGTLTLGASAVLSPHYDDPSSTCTLGTLQVQ